MPKEVKEVLGVGGRCVAWLCTWESLRERPSGMCFICVVMGLHLRLGLGQNRRRPAQAIAVATQRLGWQRRLG